LGLVAWLSFILGYSFGAHGICFRLDEPSCRDADWRYLSYFILLRWLTYWQTLISGFLAIAAALIGGFFISRQIAQIDKLEADRIVRRHTALRASMPLTLSAIAEYADECAQVLLQIHRTARDEEIPPATVLPEIPKLPTFAIDQIERIIETCDPAVAAPFIAMLKKVQIQSARLRTVYSNLLAPAGRATLVLKVNIEEYIIDSAWISAQAGALFIYARGEADAPPATVSWDSIPPALRLIGIWDDYIPRVFETVKSRAENPIR
jgi:hypothetical protein